MFFLEIDMVICTGNSEKIQVIGQCKLMNSLLEEILSNLTFSDIISF
jgi:hypothetical protein